MGESVRRTWIGLLAACALILASSGSASATPLSYTFDSDNQGWSQNQDQASNDFVSAGFQPTDGNPGGHLSAGTPGSDTGCPKSRPL